MVNNMQISSYATTKLFLLLPILLFYSKEMHFALHIPSLLFSVYKLLLRTNNLLCWNFHESCV